MGGEGGEVTTNRFGNMYFLWGEGKLQLLICCRTRKRAL